MAAALNEGRLYYQELMGTDRNVADNLSRAMNRLFREIDQNGDGWVIVYEVMDFMTERRVPHAVTHRVFEGMGLTWNHCLSIEDFVALGCIFMMWPSCVRCKSIIFDMYYTCIPCHNRCTNRQAADAYQLCPMCFKSGDFLHGHGPFQQCFHRVGQGTGMSYNQGLQGMTTSFHGVGQGTALSYNQGLQGMTTSFHGVGQGTAMSNNQGLQGMTTSFHGVGQGTVMSYNQGLQGMTTSFHGGGQGPAMSYNQGLQGMTTSFHGGGQGPAMSYNQGLQGMTTNFHGSGQGTAMSYNQGLQGMITSFHGGGQGLAMSYNQGLQGMTTNLQGGGQEEGMQKFSLEKVLQIVANFAAIGSMAAGVAALSCSIM